MPDVKGKLQTYMTCAIVEIDRPRLVMAAASGLLFSATANVRLRPCEDGSTEVDYAAGLRLRGAARPLSPFLKGAFDRFADRGMVGLMTALS